MTDFPQAKPRTPFTHLPPPPLEPDQPAPPAAAKHRAVTAQTAQDGWRTLVMTHGWGEGSHHVTIHSWPHEPPAQATRQWVFDGDTGHLTLPWLCERVLIKDHAAGKTLPGPVRWESGWIPVSYYNHLPPPPS